MSRTLVSRVLVVALLAFPLAACGSDEDGGDAQSSVSEATSSATSAASAVPVEGYVEDLCTSVVDYQDQLQTLNEDLQTELTSGTPTPEDVKDGLAAFLGEAASLTQGLAEDIRALGAPDVDGGDEIAVTFVNAFEQVEDLFATSKSDVEQLRTDDPAALTEGLQGVATDLQEGAQKIASAFDTLPDDIGVDPADVPACQGIV